MKEKIKEFLWVLKETSFLTKIVLSISCFCMIASILNIFIKNEVLQMIIWIGIVFVCFADIICMSKINGKVLNQNKKLLDFYLKMLSAPTEYLSNNLEKETYTKEEVLVLFDKIITEAGNPLH